MKKIKALTVLLALSLLMVACGKTTETTNSQEDNTQAGQQKLSVQTSFFVLEDFARRIGGDKVEVGAIISNGQAPHGWEPSPKDIGMLQKADVFIYNGAGLEPWVDKVLDGIDHEQVLSIEASEGVELIKGHSHDHDHEGEAVETEDHDHDHEGEAVEAEDHDHDHEGEAVEAEDHDHDHEGEAVETEDHDHDHEGGMDPHVWTSPKNAIILAENIYKGLSEKDPDNKDYYQENFKALKEELINLDKEYAETLSKAKTRDIIVSHEAYGYLAKEYDLNQVPIEGINSHSEPDPKTMQEIIDYMKEKKVDTVFAEPLIDPKVAETIAKETGAEVAILDPLEGLAEGKDLSDTSYVELMKENLKALDKALVK